MPKDKDPIVLSGKAYVDGHLAPHYRERKLPAAPQRGDVQIYCRLDDRGRANRALDDKRRKRGTIKRTRSGYSGCFMTLVFDGSAWRRLNVDAIVGGDGWYTSQRWKHEKLPSMFWHIEQCKGVAAIWGDRAYEVKEKPPRDLTAGLAAFAEIRRILSGGEPAPVTAAQPISAEPAEAVAAPTEEAPAASGKPRQLDLF
jgi:hypothetical protein